MTIDDIKAKYGIKSLDLQFSDDKETGERSEWLRFWDNSQRLGVSMTITDSDLLDANRNRTDLMDFPADRESESGKPYTHVVIRVMKDFAKSF